MFRAVPGLSPVLSSPLPPLSAFCSAMQACFLCYSLQTTSFRCPLTGPFSRPLWHSSWRCVPLNCPVSFLALLSKHSTYCQPSCIYLLLICVPTLEDKLCEVRGFCLIQYSDPPACTVQQCSLALYAHSPWRLMSAFWSVLHQSPSSLDRMPLCIFCVLVPGCTTFPPQCLYVALPSSASVQLKASFCHSLKGLCQFRGPLL